MGDEEHKRGAPEGPLMFGFDFHRRAAVLNVFHGDHWDTRLAIPWRRVPVVIEEMSKFYENVNPIVERFFELANGGMEEHDAWDQASQEAKRQWEIGER